MVDMAVVSLCLYLICLMLLFIIGLWVSQHYNSARIFYSTSIACFFFSLYMPIYLKYYSPWSLNNTSAAAEFSAGMGSLLALKFLILAFSEDWTFARQITPKRIVLECFTFPLKTESSTENTFEREGDARLEGIYTILCGIGRLVLLRVLIRRVPVEWLSLPLSSFLPFLWPLRCTLLAGILYLSLSMAMDIILGCSGLLFNVRMNSSFPFNPFLSTSVREFWSQRWDIALGRVMHRMSFVVIPRLTGTTATMNKTVRAYLGFILSGISHEFVLVMMTERLSGKWMIFFTLQAVLISIEIAMKIPAKTKTSLGKLAGWMWTMGALLATSPFYFDPLMEAQYFMRIKDNLD